jgi:6-phosphogluconate dehydrogenase
MATLEIAEVFNRWNEGELQSYLIQITGKALEQIDPETGRPIVELILDKAGQKGTGQWTIMNGAEQAVVISTINAAVEARVLSSQKAQRVTASEILHGPTAPWTGDRAALVDKIHDALYAAKVISYAQGLDLVRSMSARKGWDIDLGGLASIWRGGCIIRARFLNHITDAYRTEPGLPHLMLAPYFAALLNRTQQAWREVVAHAVTQGIPVPAMSASLGYYDSLRTARLPANLLQAQRDFFGAHTYERTDKPAGEMFHTVWPDVVG